MSAGPVMHSVVVSLHRRVCHFIFADIGVLVAVALIIGVIVLKIDPAGRVCQFVNGYSRFVLKIIRDLPGVHAEQVHRLFLTGLLHVSFLLFLRRNYQFQPRSYVESLLCVQILRFVVSREQKAIVSGLIYIVLKYPAFIL